MKRKLKPKANRGVLLHRLVGRMTVAVECGHISLIADDTGGGGRIVATHPLKDGRVPLLKLMETAAVNTPNEKGQRRGEQPKA